MNCLLYFSMHYKISIVWLPVCVYFSTVHGDIPLKPVTHYGLYLTEDDGEVDRDFPCLDPKECVAKFSFTYLSLVEHKNGKVSFDIGEPVFIEVKDEDIVTKPKGRFD